MHSFTDEICAIWPKREASRKGCGFNSHPEHKNTSFTLTMCRKSCQYLRQENIRNTEFGLWQAVVEYADHYSQKDASIATLAGRNDGIKLRALELVGI